MGYSDELGWWFCFPSIVVCYYWSSYYRNSGWISLAEEGLSEADICDDFVRQHVSSWTSVCYTGIIYRFSQGQKRSSCENFWELSFWSKVSELVISWIPLVVSGELKRVTYWVVHLSLRYSYVIMWHWLADTLFWQLSIDHNLDVQYQAKRSLWYALDF